MFSTLRTRFGIPGVISVIALVFALFGGAYAASNGSSGGKATASAKAKKGPRGPKGATGPAGPAGAQGPAGPAGAKGDAGANGANGSAGATGATGVAGTSVTNTVLAKGNVNCLEGGAEFKVGAGTPTRACNGVTGFTATLPKEKTETGTWTAFLLTESLQKFIGSTISYPIPLSKPSAHTVVLNREQTEGSTTTPVEGCKFELENQAAVPVAPPATLCIFITEEQLGSISRVAQPGAVGEDGDSPAGAFLTTETSEKGKLRLAGVWAVTAA